MRTEHVGGGDAANDLERLAHPRARRDDVGLARAGREDAELGRLVAQAPLGEGAAEEEHELLELEGLGEVMVRAEANALDRRVDRAVSGHHEHGQIGIEATDAAEELEPVDAGHAEIGDEGVDVAVVDLGEGALGAGQRNALVARVGEAVGEHLGHRRLIVDDEDARALPFHASG